MTTLRATETLDMTGKSITTYIAVHAAQRLAEMAPGEVLDVVADNYEPIARDIPTWCAAAGHTVLGVDDEDATLRFHIAKGGGERPVPKRLAMVVSDPGLEELLSPLGFALAAALEGDEVSIHFQGPAVRILAEGFSAKMHGWKRPVSLLARRGMAKAGHSEPQVKLQQLHDLGAQFYACGPSMDHFNVAAADLAFPDIPIVEYLTFIKVMRDADAQVFVQ